MVQSHFQTLAATEHRMVISRECPVDLLRDAVHIDAVSLEDGLAAEGVSGDTVGAVLPATTLSSMVLPELRFDTDDNEFSPVDGLAGAPAPGTPIEMIAPFAQSVEAEAVDLTGAPT